MANVDKVNGFRPVQYLNGAAWNGQATKYYKAAGTTVTHDLFVGDLVTPSGSGDADGVPAVVAASAGSENAILGVIVGVVPDPDHLDRNSWIDGADEGYVLVVDDPNIIFEAQADGALAESDLFNNAPMVKTAAGSRTAGTSGQEVDATVATTAANQLKIIGFPQRPDNTIDSADNKVLVIINNHIFKGGTGTEGV
jgi:hypothetical protein